jgi:hypothetical protein
MCTSCLKHKPPVIDVEQGSKDAPITLDSDSDEEKPVAVENTTVSSNEWKQIIAKASCEILNFTGNFINWESFI